LKLPNGHLAVVELKKLVGYSLDRDHRVGRNKALVFRSALGIGKENADLLLTALRQAAATEEAVYLETDAYGRHYRIDFNITGPGGTATVRSGWCIDPDSEVPRLATCYVLR